MRFHRMNKGSGSAAINNLEGEVKSNRLLFFCLHCLHVDIRLWLGCCTHSFKLEGEVSPKSKPTTFFCLHSLHVYIRVRLCPNTQDRLQAASLSGSVLVSKVGQSDLSLSISKE